MTGNKKVSSKASIQETLKCAKEWRTLASFHPVTYYWLGISSHHLIAQQSQMEIPVVFRVAVSRNKCMTPIFHKITLLILQVSKGGVTITGMCQTHSDQSSDVWLALMLGSNNRWFHDKLLFFNNNDYWMHGNEAHLFIPCPRNSSDRSNNLRRSLRLLQPYVLFFLHNQLYENHKTSKRKFMTI